MGNKQSSSNQQSPNGDTNASNVSGTAPAVSRSERKRTGRRLGRGEQRSTRKGRRSKSKDSRRNGSVDGNNIGDSEGEEEFEKMSYLQMARYGYNELVRAIIRPPRAEYKNQMLGPSSFQIKGENFKRNDLELRNGRGQKLVCSHWVPDQTPQQQRPCIIYLHGNSSCRLEALDCLPVVLSQGLTLFAFDFAGSGKSDGEYISLGWYEREDVTAVVAHLRNMDSVSTIGIWGRSMGAATALMFGNRDPSIACLILDSPFTSLPTLARELVDSAQINIPKFAISLALRFIRSSVKSRAKFDINKLEPIKYCENCFIPALFGAAEDDDFIKKHHAQELHDKYAGDKNLILFSGDHNSRREQFFFTSVSIFLHETLVKPALGAAATSPELSAAMQEDLNAELLGSSFMPAFDMPAPLGEMRVTGGAMQDSYMGNSSFDRQPSLVKNLISMVLNFMA